MMRRWLTVAALALPATVRAQATDISPAARWDSLPIGSRIRAEAPGILAGRQTAVLLRRSGDTLTLGVKGDDPVAVPVSRIALLETSVSSSQRGGAVRGAAILGAFGASVYLLDRHFRRDACLKTIQNECAGGPPSRFSATGFAQNIVVGAVFGAIAGTFWPTEKWKTVHVSPGLSVGTRRRPEESAALTSAISR